MWTYRIEDAEHDPPDTDLELYFPFNVALERFNTNTRARGTVYVIMNPQRGDFCWCPPNIDKDTLYSYLRILNSK